MCPQTRLISEPRFVGGTLNKGLLSPSAGARALRGHECVWQSQQGKAVSQLYTYHKEPMKRRPCTWRRCRSACEVQSGERVWTCRQNKLQNSHKDKELLPANVAVSAQPNQRLSQASAESEDASSRVTAFSATAALIVPDVPQEARAGNVIPTRRLISEHIDTNADSR